MDDNERWVNEMRIAVTQFEVRDVSSFDDFAEHVAWHVEGAVWQEARCVVFPEYFTSELLTTFPEARTTTCQEATRVFERLGREYTGAYLDLFTNLARDEGIYIVGGSLFYFNDATGATTTPASSSTRTVASGSNGRRTAPTSSSTTAKWSPPGIA